MAAARSDLMSVEKQNKTQENKGSLWFEIPDGLCMWLPQLLNSIFLFIFKCLILLVPHSGINDVYLKKAWQPNCNKYKRVGALERGRSRRKTLSLPAPTQQQRLPLAQLAAGREKLSKEGAHAQSKAGSFLFFVSLSWGLIASLAPL